MIEGVLVGVAASTVFAFIAVIVREWLIPKIREFSYEGATLTGTWEFYYENDVEPAAEVTLRQKGRSISGTSHVTTNTKGNKVDRRYNYSGRYLNTSAVFTFEDVHNPTVFGGTMVFHTSNSDGTAMNVIASYYKP